jgi:hypothetical protein
MAKKRIKIPPKTEDEVMFKSNSLCYCRKQGDQIHHLNGNPADNAFENLILLCFDHHHEATVIGGLKRRLSIKQLKRKRDDLYYENERKQRMELAHFGKQLKKVSEENLFRAALDANIVMNLIELKRKYYGEVDWKKRSDVLWELRKYSDCTSMRVSHEVINFLKDVAAQTRAGMTSDTSDSLVNIILEFFPYSENAKDKKSIVEIGMRCSRIGANITYDALIHLGNFAVASSGLEILKFVYKRGQELKLNQLSKSVLKDYSELTQHLLRPERNDLGDAQRLLEAFKNDLNKFGIGMPDDLDNDLIQTIDLHRGKSHIEKKPLLIGKKPLLIEKKPLLRNWTG